MKRSLISRVMTSKLIFPLLAGGTALQLGGCDPTVKDSILTGVQSSLTGLVTTVIGAFFTSLQNAGDTSGTSTSEPVIQAVQAVQHIVSWFA